MTTIGVAIITNKALDLSDYCSSLGQFDEFSIGFTEHKYFWPCPGDSPFPIRTVEIPWTDSFSEARNKLLAHCTTDWMLWLDADEEIDPKEWGRSVRRRLARDEHISAYRLDLKNIVPDSSRVMGLDPLPLPDGTFASYHRGAMLRLHRNLPGISWSYRVHESLAPSLAMGGHACGEMRKTITHRGEVDAAVLEAKHKYYLDLALADAQDNDDDPKAWFNVLTEAQASGFWAIAVHACERVWALQDISPIFTYEVAAIASYNLLRTEIACQYARTILSSEPRNPIATMILDSSSALIGEK